MSTKPSSKKKGPPGQWLKRAANGNKVAYLLLKHAHVLQIVDDHHLMYLEAANDEEREQIRARCRKQLLLAGVSWGGWFVAEHGLVDLFIHPMVGGAVLLLGAAVIFFTGRGR